MLAESAVWTASTASSGHGIRTVLRTIRGYERLAVIADDMNALSANSHLLRRPRSRRGGDGSAADGKRAVAVLWRGRLPGRSVQRRLGADRLPMNIRAKRTEVMATDIHAEHVGSLLRQPWLLAARGDYKAGKITEGELRATEDRAAAENIAVQRSAGIRVFTDGEVRRTNWMTGILESIGGMSAIETPAVTWHRPTGEIPPEEETDFVMTAASAKVFQKDHLTAVEAAYMASQVPGAFKITMMSAAMGGMTWRPEVSAEAY